MAGPSSRRRNRILALGSLFAVAILAACSGGGGGSSAPSTPVHPVSTPTSGAVATPAPNSAPANFTIKIPAGSSTSGASRRTRLVSPNTASIVITLISASDTTVTIPQSGTFNVSATSSICTTDSTGARSCNLQLSAPIGTDVFTVDAFDSSGNKLGSGAVRMTVVANQANTATVSLGGQIAEVAIYSPSQGGYALLGVPNNYLGLPGTLRVYVLGFDSSGNPIVVPDTYSSPITLTLTKPFEYISGAPVSGTPDQYYNASVAYAFPNGATSASTGPGVNTVQVTSPNDVVTLTASSTITDFLTATIYGTIGSAPAPAPAPIPTAAPGVQLQQATAPSATAAEYVELLGPPAKPVAMPTAVTIDYDSPQSANFQVIEQNYFGTYSENDTCGGYATVTQSTSGNFTVTYSHVNAGSIGRRPVGKRRTQGFGVQPCTVTVFDSKDQSVTVAVTVDYYTNANTLTVAPTSISLGGTNPSSTTVTVTEPGSSGSFSIYSDTCTSENLSVTPSGANSTTGSQVWTIAQTATTTSGSCSIQFEDSESELTPLVSITTTNAPTATISFGQVSAGSVPAPGPTTIPNPSGKGPAQGSYPLGEASASVDLNTLTTHGSNPYAFIQLSDTTPVANLTYTSTSTACSFLSFETASPLVLSNGVYTLGLYLPNPSATSGPVCVVTFNDGMGSQAALELYYSNNSITVSGKGRKK